MLRARCLTLLVRFSSLLVALSAAGSASAQPENFLVILADDIGIEKIGSFGVWSQLGQAAPLTPHLDALAADAVRFDAVWSAPNCSPTRSMLMTGRYGFRTGVGNLVGAAGGGTYSLPTNELSLPRLLDPAGYTSAALGKWHLAAAPGGEATAHPLALGFDEHSGSVANLDREQLTSGSQTLTGNYFSWKWILNGVFPSDYLSVYSNPFAPSAATYANPENYATRWIANEAIRRIDGNGAGDLPEPWLLYVAFHAGHDPFHIPPSNRSPAAVVPPAGRLYQLDTELSASPTGAELQRAMIEALDIEIGRILDSLPAAVAARTTVIFVSDNGTPEEAREAPLVAGRVKGSLHQGGIRVPLIIKSPRLANYAANRGKTSHALATVADVFDTVRDIANDFSSGVPASGGDDSKSLALFLRDAGLGTLQELPAQSQHAFVYAEKFDPNGLPSSDAQSIPAEIDNPAAPTYQDSYSRAIRDDRYKLIRRDGLDSDLFDLRLDPLETQNRIGDPLLAAQRAALVQGMAEIVGLARCGGRNDIDGDLHCDDDDRCVLRADADASPLTQADHDDDGYGDGCDPDFDQSGAVGIADFVTWRSCFGKTVPQPGPLPVDDPSCAKSDLDGTGRVLIPDLKILRELYGRPPGPSGPCGHVGWNGSCDPP
jgi:arylsulfatase A-like enzyme